MCCLCHSDHHGVPPAEVVLPENHTGRNIDQKCMQILPGSDQICGAEPGITCEEWASK